MRIFPPALIVSDTEGFDPRKDLFGRSELGAGLTNLITSVADPMVIALDAQWGAGKTTFLKMWAGELRKRDVPVIFFDAFENDYAEDAFTSLASEVVSLLNQKMKGNTSAAQKFLGHAVGAGKVLMRSGLKLGVKAATLGVLTSADLEEIAGSISDEAGDIADKYVGELLTRQKREKEALAAFRDALEQLPSVLADGGQAEGCPLVFIIDELDRCRPDFALQLLERVKHFFAVDNVHFVLGVHMAQLHNSVRITYGDGVDAHAYLQKFIHATFTLVDDAEQSRDRVINKYVSYLQRNMGFRSEDAETVNYCGEFIARVAEARGLSLRAIERIFTALAMALAYTGKNDLRPPPIFAGLCVLRVIAPDLYAKAKTGVLEYEDVRVVLGFYAPPREGERSIEYAAKWWRFCTDRNADAGLVKSISDSIVRYGIWEREEVLTSIVRAIDRLHSD